MAKVQKACEELSKNPRLKILTVAQVHGVNRNTLANHHFGLTKFHDKAHEAEQSLGQGEEKQIEEWIQAMDDQGTPPRRRHVRDMVDFLLQQHARNPNQEMAPLGKNWTERFLKQHPALSFRVAQPINKDRALAQEPVRVNGFYNRLSEVRSRYKIIDDDVWNSDEKGFAIGLAIGGKIFCRSGKRNSRLVQDGGREWVTLVESISAAGGVTPPFLVYAAKSQRESWHDYIERDEATFSISDNGYMHRRLTLKWMKGHFAKYSPPSSPAAHCLLILDNHTSHQNFDFYHYCWEHRIHILFFPSHLTHVLQPLDQNPFSAIATRYQQLVEEFYRIHGPYSSIHKGDFFPMMQLARKESLTTVSVKAAFRFTGIAPLNRQRVLLDRGLQFSTIPPNSIPYRLRPGPSQNGATNQMQQLREALLNATSLEEAQRIGQELVTLAEGVSAKSAIATKSLEDQLKKRNPSKAKAGGVITKAEVIGRKALDKAYKEKLARNAKAKLTAEKKRKQMGGKDEQPKNRSKNRQTISPDYDISIDQEIVVEIHSDSAASDISQELVECASSEGGGPSHVHDQGRLGREHALGDASLEGILEETSDNIHRNPLRSTRRNCSFREILFGS